MGTFGSFTTVRLGIYSAQKGLDVTGNNITNINTEGYTRQRLNQVSLIPSVSDRYSSSYSNRIGQGALIAGVNQVRDPGMDISYRNATTDVGSANSKLEGLNSLATILDEVGKGSLDQDDGVILSQLNDIRDLINKAIASGGSSTYNDLIRSSAAALVTHFNSYADKLEKLQGTYENKLNQQVTEVNDILTQIRDLNLSIRDADLRGDPGLELRDQRNLLLDQLSEYMDIDVKYSQEKVGPDTYVEKLTVTLANSEPHNHTLVDGLYSAKLGVDNSGNYGINLYALRDADGEKKNPKDTDPLPLEEGDLYGSIQSLREILTGKGEYATSPDSLKTALDTEVNRVNKLLHQIQDKNNKINGLTDPEAIAATKEEREQLLTELKGLAKVTVTPAGDSVSIALEDGTSLLDASGAVTELQGQLGADDKYEITVKGVVYSVGGEIQKLQNTLNNDMADTQINPDASSIRGIPYYRMALDSLANEFATQMNELNNTGLGGSGNLFSIGSDTNATIGVDANGNPIRITASNISVSKGWDNQSIYIQTTADPHAPSGDTSQLSKFLALFDKELDFEPGDINVGAGGDPYKGTFEGMLLKMQSTLAEDQMSTDAVLNNYVVTMGDLYVDREGVTGVDLNDEATNLMTYQKAYTAACRLMTTLEQALDSLLAM